MGDERPDIDILQSLLRRAGIPFTHEAYQGTPHLPAAWTLRVEANAPIMSGLPTPVHPHRTQVFGYMGFYTDFYFDAVGVLLNMGAYE